MAVFAFFKNTQMIYAEYIYVAPGKPHTGPVKLKISPGTGRLNFHWVKGKSHCMGRVSLGLLQRGDSRLRQDSSEKFDGVIACIGKGIIAK